jgi:hypothetical protein
VTNTPSPTSTKTAHRCDSADINRDGRIDGKDLQMLIRALIRGSKDAKFDLNHDGKVDWNDLRFLIKCAREWAEPTKTPKPTETPKPKKTSKPTKTPKPTDTPKPAKTPKHDKPTKTPTAPID